MIIDDRPWEWLSEEEKKEREAAQKRYWDSLTKEEKEMIEQGVKKFIEEEKRNQNN